MTIYKITKRRNFAYQILLEDCFLVYCSIPLTIMFINLKIGGGGGGCGVHLWCFFFDSIFFLQNQPRPLRPSWLQAWRIWTLRWSTKEIWTWRWRGYTWCRQRTTRRPTSGIQYLLDGRNLKRQEYIYKSFVKYPALSLIYCFYKERN